MTPKWKVAYGVNGQYVDQLELLEQTYFNFFIKKSFMASITFLLWSNFPEGPFYF